MNYTKYYNLKKPEQNEYYDIDIINSNSDIIDSKLKLNANNISDHVSNVSNPHKVTKSQIGLSNVDNTSDVNKPVSTLQSNAISSALASAKKYSIDLFGKILWVGTSTQFDNLEKLPSDNTIVYFTDTNIIGYVKGGSVEYMTDEYISNVCHIKYVHSEPSESIDNLVWISDSNF